MTGKSMRFAYLYEFLLPLVAIFTAWCEIGGEAPLDIVHWGGKFAFSITLAAGIVGYTAAFVPGAKVGRSAPTSWLVLIVVLMVGMGVVTYYYMLEEDSGESEELTPWGSTIHASR